MNARRANVLAAAAAVVLVLGLAPALLPPGSAFAGAPSPAGLWRTIDDTTHRESSLVRITEVNGELRGVVEKILEPDAANPGHLCKACQGDRQDRPILGMTILWGLKKDGDQWSGGEILDPKNGKTYRCKMTLVDGGRSLDVRGFIGFSLLGRTQTWQRQE
jgi:uncharacterized protein (DUF2147 family)